MATANGAKTPSSLATANGANSPKVLLYSILLTLQYGSQPLVSKRFIGKDVIVTTFVLICEIFKVVFALVLMARDGTLKGVAKEWTFMGSLTASGLPAAIYAVQNTLLQISYRNLDSLTFSILNQTKIFFTAFFTFIVLRQKQSIQQVGALCLLIMAAVLLSVGEGSNKGPSASNSDQVLFYGIIPALVASLLSGLASSLCQWASQVKNRSSYLLTVEMSIVGSLCLLVSLLKFPDGEAIKRYGFFHGWTALTLVPVISDALGGILVGLVTSHAGGVRKGFVIVLALLVSALLQYVFEGKPPSLYCLVALPIVMTSISLYQKYPYTARRRRRSKDPFTD
ncbi:PREDICTED: CMP-sialic acid transporter 5-like [Camelina sativa]|uniref:CMP-sialic acid transporter 5-like n=1 Tax=Camelina sativa TaxID=90675 RepID=A0ABM0XDI0_CAMSA|nr:PREDICTED: CMP-sialic acid transporter 5-like [Camelina sativa]